MTEESSSLRVVLVDDELLIRVGLINAVNWNAYGMKIVAEFTNGAEAWDYLNKEDADLLITDIRMPKMDGMTLIEHVRAHNARIRIVMLTCIEEFEAIKRAVNIGITGYIAKSTLDQNEIEQALSRVILELQEMPAKISEAQEDDLLRQQAFVDRYVFHRGNDHGDAFPFPQHNLQPILMTFDQQPNRKEQDRSSQYRTLRSVVLESGAGDLFTLACGYLIVLSTASASAVAYVTSQLDFVGRMVYNAQSRFVIGKRRDGIDSLYEQYPLLKRALEEHAGSSMCFLKETCDDYVQRAVGYINQHYAEDLSVAELAGRVGVTPNYLSSIFRKDVGGSVVEYLTRIRMENAQRLLAQTEMPVRQIAHRTGFSDYNYFTRVFKKMTAMRPTEYRMQSSRKERTNG